MAARDHFLVREYCLCVYDESYVVFARWKIDLDRILATVGNWILPKIFL